MLLSSRGRALGAQGKLQQRQPGVVHPALAPRGKPVLRAQATAEQQQQAVSVTTKSADSPSADELVVAGNGGAETSLAHGSWDELQQFIRVGSLAEQGLRPTMEDELHVEFDPTHGCLYAACYDGHGGPAAAKWLRNNFMTILSSHLAKSAPNAASNSQLPSHFEPAFKAVDEKLLAYLESLGGEDLEHAGATASVLLLWKHRVVVANVGDSQAWLWRKGKAVSLTVPHRVYGLDPEVEVEIERVEATGGWVYDGRVCNVLAVSRAFGDWEFKGKGLPQLLSAGVERGYWPASFIKSINFTSDPVIVTPDTCDMQLTEDDEFLVLSTDGLWDVMPPRDAMQWARKELQKGLTPEQVAGSLVHEALRRQQAPGGGGLVELLLGAAAPGAMPPTVQPIESREQALQAVRAQRAQLQQQQQQVADSLVKLALKRHTSDNTSCVVIDLKGPEHWASFKKQGGLFGGLFK